MMNKRLGKVWSDLPTDLWPQILCRIPVKSLLRFRCVSKSWLSLIGDADFACLHLKNFKNNYEETHLLVVSRGKCAIRCSDTFETNSETLLNLYNIEGYYWSTIVSSVNGLILLKRYGLFDLPSALMVWNPSIRKFHTFPSLPEIEISPASCLTISDIGYGYDPLAKDYKHLKLIFVDDTIHSVAIYTLGARSWKIIKFQGKWRWQNYPFRRSNVYFNGRLYFITKDVNNGCGWDLVSFDFSSELFSVVGVSSSFEAQDELALIDNGRSLAVYDLRNKSVWVMESGSML